MRNPYPIVGMFLAMSLCFSCGSNKQPQNPSEEVSEEASQENSATLTVAKPIVLFFGNSLTAGYGLELEEAFPALIQAKMDSAGIGFEAQNSGVSGETTSGGDSRIDFVLNSLEAPLAVFVLELGANDGLRGIELSATKANLQSIINKVRAKQPQAKILLCGMEVPPNMGDSYTQTFRTLFPDLAKENDCALVPFLLQDVAGIPNLNQADGIHPTAEGNIIVAKTIWEVLEGMLAEFS